MKDFIEDIFIYGYVYKNKMRKINFCIILFFTFVISNIFKNKKSIIDKV